MTYEELQAKIGNLHNEYSDAGEEATKQYRGMLKFQYTLKAVIELHKPKKYLNDERLWCSHCLESSTIYPCYTIKTIEKVLDDTR